MQAKLLRVIETGEFERLGSPRTMKVNVRVIAATNRDLRGCPQGALPPGPLLPAQRLPHRVPPLRERAEDIPLLVGDFLEEFSSRMAKQITQVPRETMAALQRYAWPGNVRELKNVIERGAIVTTGGTLRVPMIDDSLPGSTPSPTLADSERDIIVRSLERAGGHIKGPRGAAAALGLNASTLYGRMKKLGIHPPARRTTTRTTRLDAARSRGRSPDRMPTRGRHLVLRPCSSALPPPRFTPPNPDKPTG